MGTHVSSEVIFSAESFLASGEGTGKWFLWMSLGWKLQLPWCAYVNVAHTWLSSEIQSNNTHKCKVLSRWWNHYLSLNYLTGNWARCPSLWKIDCESVGIPTILNLARWEISQKVLEYWTSRKKIVVIIFWAVSAKILTLKVWGELMV